MNLSYFTMPLHPLQRNYTETLKEDREAIILADKLGLALVVGRPVPIDVQTLLTVLYTGAFASVLGILCWNAGVARVGPTMAGFFFFLMPVFGTALAMIFLGEQVYAYHATGIVTIFAGIYFITSRRRG